MADVFISYSRRDEEFVERLRETLADNGKDVWVDREDIGPAAVGVHGQGAAYQLTVSVENVDATAAELAARGVTLLNGPMDRPWGIRTASFQDPAGHIWEIAK